MAIVTDRTDPAGRSLEPTGFDRKIWIPFRLDAERFALLERKDVLFDVRSEWGAQVHFLYCRGEAIVLALVIGHALGGYNHCRLLLVGAIFLLASGLAHHLSRIYRATVVWKQTIADKLSKKMPDQTAPAD